MARESVSIGDKRAQPVVAYMLRCREAGLGQDLVQYDELLRALLMVGVARGVI